MRVADAANQVGSLGRVDEAERYRLFDPGDPGPPNHVGLVRVLGPEHRQPGGIGKRGTIERIERQTRDPAAEPALIEPEPGCG